MPLKAAIIFADDFRYFCAAASNVIAARRAAAAARHTRTKRQTSTSAPRGMPRCYGKEQTPRKRQTGAPA